jgi:hypothetical protein
MTRWAQVAARFVRPGGFFYIAEFHPTAQVFDNDPSVTGLQVRFPYLTQEEPFTFDEDGSYADATAHLQNTIGHEWSHPLGSVVTALINSGLRIEYVHEFPFCIIQMFPFMERGADGYWRLPRHSESVPLTYSIKATKSA